MQTPPHSEPLSSIVFARKPSEPQFFNTLNMDDILEIQSVDIPNPFTAEIGAILSNI